MSSRELLELNIIIYAIKSFFVNAGGLLLEEVKNFFVELFHVLALGAGFVFEFVVVRVLESQPHNELEGRAVSNGSLQTVELL